MQTTTDQTTVEVIMPDGKRIDATEAFRRESKKRGLGAPATTERQRAAEESSGAISIDLIRPRIAELVALHERKTDAAASYKDAVKAVATKGGVSEKTLNRYVAAKVKDKLAEEHARTQQLALLFEEL